MIADQNEDETSIHLQNPKPVFDNITELSLHYISIDSETAVQFLSCFPNLERLHYKNGISGYAICEPPKYLAALQRCKSTLQDLCLLNASQVGASELENFPLGSLAGFENLKRLELDPTMLLGCLGQEGEILESEGFKSTQDMANCLPRSVEELKLHRPENAWLIPSKLFELVALKEENFPLLKKIDMEWERIEHQDYPSIHPGFTEEEAAQFYRECQNANVELVMMTQSP
jgi:hypothetical protein